MDYIKKILKSIEEEVIRERRKSYLKSVDVQGHKVDWWTGGNLEDDWTWAKSKKPVGDFVWASGQPNGGKGENCLFLYQGRSYEGCDLPCTITLLYPICQLNI